MYAPGYTLLETNLPYLEGEEELDRVPEKVESEEVVGGASEATQSCGGPIELVFLLRDYVRVNPRWRPTKSVARIRTWMWRTLTGWTGLRSLTWSCTWSSVPR